MHTVRRDAAHNEESSVRYCTQRVRLCCTQRVRSCAIVYTMRCVHYRTRIHSLCATLMVYTIAHSWEEKPSVRCRTQWEEILHTMIRAVCDTTHDGIHYHSFVQCDITLSLRHHSISRCNTMSLYLTIAISMECNAISLDLGHHSRMQCDITPSRDAIHYCTL